MKKPGRPFRVCLVFQFSQDADEDCTDWEYTVSSPF